MAGLTIEMGQHFSTRDHKIYWALGWGVIKDEKWYYSEREGKDIGVPKTVDRIIRSYPHVFEPNDRTPLIEGYLLGVAIPDEHDVNQFRGEIKRFIAQRDNIKPEEIHIYGFRDVEEYCDKNNIQGNLRKRLIRNF